MLSKLLSEKDMEIHKFVNNLELKLQDKEALLVELKAQKEELQADFTYNLSLLKSIIILFILPLILPKLENITI